MTSRTRIARSLSIDMARVHEHGELEPKIAWRDEAGGSGVLKSVPPTPRMYDDETRLAYMLVKELISRLPGPERTGLLWVSPTAGSQAYATVLSRSGDERIRAVAGVGPVSGANGVNAVVAVGLGLRGPSTSLLECPPAFLARIAADHIEHGRADAMVTGVSLVHPDRIVAHADLLIGGDHD